MNGKVLVLITLGFFLGVFVGSFFRPDFYTFLFFIFLAFVLVFKFLNFGQNAGKKKVFLIFVVLGLLRVYSAEFFLTERDFLPIEEKHDFVGLVYREPDRRDDKTLIYLKAKLVDSEIVEEKKFQKILVYGPLYPKIEIGEKVYFRGELLQPKAFESAGRLFDYPGFLKKDGISLVMYRPEIKSVEPAGCCVVLSRIVGFKDRFKENLNELVRSPESSLLSGILLGDKRSSGPEWLEKFRQTGLIHIVVLSGYNLSLVSDFALRAFGFLPGNFALLATTIAILIFISAVGGGATVFRAGTMAMIAILARFLGRKYEVGNSLFLAGLIMVAWNPFILVFDPSFQLSFLATFALIYISPYFEAKIAGIKIGKFLTLKNIIATTLAVQLFVTPFLLYLTGNLPLFSLPANILVLPLVPIAMFLGALAGFLSFFGNFFALPVAWLAQGVLFTILLITDLISAFTPKIETPAFSFWLVFVIYVGFYFLFRRLLKTKKI